jgi:hypothetical protein
MRVRDKLIEKAGDNMLPTKEVMNWAARVSGSAAMVSPILTKHHAKKRKPELPACEPPGVVVGDVRAVLALAVLMVVDLGLDIVKVGCGRDSFSSHA